MSARFDDRITREPESDCWNWTGPWNGNGYGVFSEHGVHVYAHRYSYERAKGPIPEALQIDHLCRNRACVNPAHLEAVTRQINVLRGISPAAQQAKQTHCLRGHPYDLFNTYRDSQGKRHCRECMRLHDRGRRDAAYWRAYRVRRALKESK